MLNFTICDHQYLHIEIVHISTMKTTYWICLSHCSDQALQAGYLNLEFMVTHAHWNRCTAITEPILQGAFSVISAWYGSGSPICYQGRIIWTFQNRWEIEKIPFRSRDIGCWLKKTCLSISRNFKRLNPKNELLFFSETLHTSLYLIEIQPCKISHRNYKPFTTCKAF